jgi:hypothetical protein
MIQKLGDIGAEANEDISDWLPPWMKGAIIWNKQDPENLKYLSTFGLNPFAEFANPFDPEGMMPGLLKMGQLAPPWQAALSGFGIDPMTAEPTPIAPDSGVTSNWWGQLFKEGKETSLAANRAPQRVLGGLMRSLPQVRNAELLNTLGRPVYPESIPFISEKPMDVREETIRTPEAIAGSFFGVNPRRRDLEHDKELLEEGAAFAAEKNKRQREAYLKFLRNAYGR